jgi:hypothetical protein
MKNCKLGYVRMYLDAKDIEDFVTSRLDKKYEGKPVILTGAEFNSHDRSLDLFLNILLDECDVIDSENLVSGGKGAWGIDRMKINLEELMGEIETDSIANQIIKLNKVTDSMIEVYEKAVLHNDFTMADAAIRTIRNSTRTISDLTGIVTRLDNHYCN